MHQIKINGKTFFAEDGELLSDVLIRNSVCVEHPCAGRGICKKCTVTVNGREELSCQYRVKCDITVENTENGRIFSQTGAEESGVVTENMCLALDIGTTTLALALVSLDEKRIVKAVTGTNPQRIFGADVINRIDYCCKNGAAQLQSAVIAQVNKMIALLGFGNTEKMFVSGNTTMLHLFFGVDCSDMGVAPYTPVFLESRKMKADELGITGATEVISLPSIASFVGADIVAGVNFISMPAENKYNVLLDLGTNAEIVLYSSETLLCTSAAAGPCFEGANISCGMSATNGAIYSYSDSQVKTIGNMPAKGICGTGLVDIIAELLASEKIDEGGYMDDSDFEVADGIYLTQDDIRQYQLAKSAVYSAVMTLMKIQDISFDDIEAFYISGGFSAKINIANAVKTGLLPKEALCKCIAVNNSSLLGTVKFACEENDLSKYLANAQYVDLSLNKDFADLFIENMMFE